MLASSRAEAPEHLLGVRHERGQLAVLAPEPVDRRAVVVHQPREVAAALDDLAVERGRGRGAAGRAGGTPRAGRRRAPSQPLAGAVDQQLQVGARVGVERRETSSAFTSGSVLATSIDAVLRHRRLAAACPGRARGTCPSGRCAGAAARVASRAHQVVVLGVEVHAHARRAVLELDLADVAHAHAGHAHGLALARGHALGVRSSTQTRERLVLDAAGSAAAGWRGCSRRRRARARSCRARRRSRAGGSRIARLTARPRPWRSSCRSQPGPRQRVDAPACRRASRARTRAARSSARSRRRAARPSARVVARGA